LRPELEAKVRQGALPVILLIVYATTGAQVAPFAAVDWAELDARLTLKDDFREAYLTVPDPLQKVRIELDLPADLFDAQYPESDFAERVRELAILELVRVKRMHEHEAQRALKLERWELVERMEAAGIKPTEKLFAEITGELKSAVVARRNDRK
jgi:hypothetical protein